MESVAAEDLFPERFRIKSTGTDSGADQGTDAVEV